MYLTRIDKKTGLLLIDDNEDGVLAIKEFKAILDDKSLGLQCLTAIALTADYQSPIKFYSDEDRPKKSMEEVVGNRKAFEWNLDIIQKALKKYDDLQYDPTIEEGKIHYQRKVNKLRQYKESEEKYGKGLVDENDALLIIKSPAEVSKELRQVNADIAEYEKNIQGKDIYKESPVKNGYALSRLEQKIEKKNSFYKTTR